MNKNETPYDILKSLVLTPPELTGDLATDKRLIYEHAMNIYDTLSVTEALNVLGDDGK